MQHGRGDPSGRPYEEPARHDSTPQGHTAVHPYSAPHGGRDARDPGDISARSLR